ncbi:MAG TPA: SOS response-associated peptidase family protein [Acidobacteriaceae bacterium]
MAPLPAVAAKAETITTAPAFREAIKYRRCLVSADAFYEWVKLIEIPTAGSGARPS